MDAWLLTLVTFFPLVGVLLLLFQDPERKDALRWTALLASGVTFLISLVMLARFDAGNPDLQLVVRVPWIQVAGWDITYALGVDGLSILLVLLTTFLTPISILSTWTAVEDRVRDFMIFFLLLEVGMTGVFLAQDLFLFYVFWEFTLVPMYFLIGILYGAAVSYAQQDVKKLVAYSSVSHLGFVMLGLFALNSQGIQGGILQMVNHGLSTGALFLIVGMIYERRHTRDMDAFGGLWKIMPVYGVMTLVVVLSSMGLPGLNGFVGEFTILLGAFGSRAINSSWYAGFAAAGVILAAVYMLYMFQKMFLGPVDKEENQGLSDLNWREVAILVPLLVLIFWIGLYPRPFFTLMAPAVDQLVAVMQTAAVVAVP